MNALRAMTFSVCCIAALPLSACGDQVAPAATLQPLPSVTIAATPTTVPSGQPTTLTWSSANATSCAASGAWTGSKTTSGNQVASPTSNSNYQITCDGPGGTSSAAANVTVTTPPPAPLPTVSLAAAPSAIVAGQQSTLSWTSSNATTCTASLGWSGTRTTSGTQSVTPTTTTSYALACVGSGGTASASVQVTISALPAPLPTVTLSAVPSAIVPGQSATLTWTSSNADSCSAAGGWSGTKNTSGTTAVSPSITASYQLSCMGAGGTASSSATVTVNTAPPPTSANLFVSTTGDDNNNGSTNQPFRTLQKAANVVVPGDIVSVAAGQYVGFTISRSGTPASPIVFRAEGNVAVSQGSSGNGILISDSSYITIEGFSISGTNLKGIAARGATPSSPMRGLRIRSNSVVNTREEGMYLSEVSESLIENNTITDVGIAGVQTTGHGIYLANAGSKNTTIRGNTFQARNNTWGEALHVNGDASVGGDGLITGLVFENNRILGGFNNGLSLDGVQNSDFRNNIIVDTNHHGIRAYQIDGFAGPINLRIVNNTIRAPAGNAVKTTEDTGASIIFNNILNASDGSMSSGVTATTAANLSTFSANNTDFKPLTAAVGQGVGSLAGVSAPATDINGTARQSPPDIGAVQH